MHYAWRTHFVDKLKLVVMSSAVFQVFLLITQSEVCNNTFEGRWRWPSGVRFENSQLKWRIPLWNVVVLLMLSCERYYFFGQMLMPTDFSQECIFEIFRCVIACFRRYPYDTIILGTSNSFLLSTSLFQPVLAFRSGDDTNANDYADDSIPQFYRNFRWWWLQSFGISVCSSRKCGRCGKFDVLLPPIENLVYTTTMLNERRWFRENEQFERITKAACFGTKKN